MIRLSSSQHKLRSEHRICDMLLIATENRKFIHLEMKVFYAFLWHFTNPNLKKSFSKQLHTRTGTIQMLKPASAWVFFKPCSFTHLNALLPRCVWVTIWHKEGYFYPTEPKSDFLTPHGRFNFLSSVTNLSIRASIPVKEARKANGKNIGICLDGPTASIPARISGREWK